MFKINYRIPIKEKELLKKLSEKEINEGGHIEGYFEVIVNHNQYGYCKSGILQPDEEGFDLLTTWLEGLLEVIILLKDYNNYVALSDIDSYNTWLEFKKIKDNVISISVIEAEKKDGIGLVTAKHLENVIYSDWKNQEVFSEEIYKEVISKVKNYFYEVGKINKKLLQSFSFLKLKELVHKFES